MSQLLSKIESSSFSIFVKNRMIEEVNINPQSPKIIELLQSAKSTISLEDEKEIIRLFRQQA